VTTFALVHGAWHDASCWVELARELARRGHVVVAPRLPGDDPTATVEDYAAAVAEALAGARGEVVVVGHSLAGRTIPLVPARTHVDRLVYLAALVEAPPVEGEPELFQPGALDPLARDELGRTFWPTLASVQGIYRRLPEPVRRATFATLRPQAPTSWLAADPAPVPASLILCLEDEFFRPGWMRWAARERLGIDATPLASGHFPMLECPLRLADLLTA
jgi:hypothetical protein